MKIKHYKARLSLYQKILRRLFVLAIIFMIASTILFVVFAKDLPDPKRLRDREINESTQIFDRSGETELYAIHGDEQRTVVSLDEIPKNAINATIAVEDNNFYSHFGIDFRAIARAAWTNLRQRKIKEGASTITQQLVKNSFLAPSRTITRKIKEIILSLELEARFTKSEILELYFNQIPYGSNAYGIEAAANSFFGKHAKDLTLNESALLAALPKAPTYYSPYGNHVKELMNRRDYVLDRMALLGYITKNEADEAKKETPTFSKIKENISAPHFVLFVRDYLNDKYGEDFVARAGLKVYTTLDWKLQEAAQEAVENGAKINEARFNAHNAAFVAIDPKTGQILAMVGSRNYFDLQNDGNVNVALRPRQPGSSFKPFVYATAFKKGYPPETVIFDIPIEFGPDCPIPLGKPIPDDQKDDLKLKCYRPRDYDGKFRGPIDMRHAIAQSLNLPSVQVLYLAGVNDSIDTAEDLGITTLKDRSRYGLSLVLGSGEVKLLDMVSAFGVFAQDGIRHPYTPILKIEDRNGKVLEEYQDQPQQVLDPQIAREINDVLSDNEARAPQFGAHSPLYFADRQVAVKTGTTQFDSDFWTIGYTPTLVAGVWVGNNDNSSMVSERAGYVAAPIWHNFMEKAFENASSEEEFLKPEPVVVDKPMLNGRWLQPDGQIHSILNYVDINNPLGAIPSDPNKDPDYKNWESAIQDWFSNNPNVAQSKTTIDYPKITILAPQNNELIKKDSYEINVDVQNEGGIAQVDFFLDGNFLGTLLSSPYKLDFAVPLNDPDKSHTILVKAYSNQGLKSEKSVTFLTP